jgi:hypothetical protein
LVGIFLFLLCLLFLRSLKNDGDFVAVLRFLDGLQSARAWLDIPGNRTHPVAQARGIRPLSPGFSLGFSSAMSSFLFSAKLAV